MSKGLKLAELSQDNRMAQMEIGAARITAEFDVERFFCLDGLLNLPREIFFGNDLGRASFDEVHLFVQWWEQFLGIAPT